MFTGIIESLGRVESLEEEGTNLHITVASPISGELKVDQSVAHNGVCLTVVEKTDNSHTVTAVKETLDKSNIGELKTGTQLNLERCMVANGRFDGHIVQGHVDGIGTVSNVEEMDGSWKFTFGLNEPTKLLVEKGSVTINGVSLTCFEVTDTSFCVAIIPYTFEHTNLGSMAIGETVNLEFDIVGKYVERMLSSREL